MTDNPYSEPISTDSVPQTNKLLFWGCGGVVGIIGVGILFLIFILPFSRGRGARPAARRTMCKNNLKHIAIGLHNYHDVYDAFPPAFTVDENGNRLHSWRTLILPYIEQKALYEQIDLSKPWNDPANLAAYETNIETYRCPSADIPPFHATYKGLVGSGLFFDSSQSRKIRDIKDGTSNTLMVVEVAQKDSVHWMTPEDVDEGFLTGIAEQTDFSHTGGFQAALADGSVRYLSKNTAAETLDALITVAGGETIGEY